MAITARFLRSFLPALVCAGLALAACSSDSDDPAPDDTMEPEPGEGGSDSNGGGKGGTSSEPSDAGSPTVTGGADGTGATGSSGEPGTGGTPTEPDPGSAGAGGTAPVDEPTAGFLHGEELYEPCAVCHQADLGGTGFYPNISMDAVNGIGSWTDAEIGKAIREGVDKDGESLCAFMIPQTDMSDEDLADLIEYLRGMPSVDRKITSACPL
ncbi:MAG: cytochrome c [Myxococcales bacterium]|nr:MAG: cytochrome c [Myxococcales bacterium]